jgi:hypothetical protein
LNAAFSRAPAALSEIFPLAEFDFAGFAEVIDH